VGLREGDAAVEVASETWIGAAELAFFLGDCRRPLEGPGGMGTWRSPARVGARGQQGTGQWGWPEGMGSRDEFVTRAWGPIGVRKEG
jgi:hypothetical protein